MREITLNSTNYKLAPGSEIIQRAINPFKGKLGAAGGLEYSDFSSASLEEYHDFRNGIGKHRAVGSDARLEFSQGIDFSIEGQAVLGPLVTSTTINAVSSPSAIVNAGFETDVSPTGGFGWIEDSGVWDRSSVQKQADTYSWRNATVVAGEYIYQDLTGYIGGGEYTFTCYRYSANATDTVKIGIDDGLTVTYSTASGSVAWVQLSVAKTIAAGATRLRLIIEIAVAGAGNTVYFDTAAISMTAEGTFTPTNFIDFQSATYCYGDKGILKFNGTTWDYVNRFSNPIDAIVVSDSTDEYLVVSSALSATLSVDGSTWLNHITWVSPDSTNDFGNWTNEANAIDDNTGSYATFGAATEYMELILTNSVTTDMIRIYASDGASGDLNINCDFYYDGAWNDVYDGEVAGAEWVTLTNAAGIKEVEKARVESSDGGTCRLWEFDFESHFHGYMAEFENRLYGIHSDGSHVQYSTAKNIDNYAGGFEITGNYGTIHDFFEGKLLADGTPTLYFCGTEGLFSLDVTNEIAYQQEVSYPPITNAGNSGMYWNANVWVTTGYGILKIGPSTATYVGPDQDDGLPSTYQGKVYDMATVNNWLVFCVNGGSTDKSSILKRNSSLGGNLQVYTTSATNKPIACVHHSPSSQYTNGRLWFGEAAVIKYMMFPDTTSNVKQISTYKYVDDSGYGTFPIFRSMAAISKTALGVAAVTKSCDATEKIEVYYGLNGAAATTLLGTFTSSPLPTKLTFNSGLGTAFYTIQFAVKLYRDATDTNSPELESLLFYYIPTPATINGWIFRVLAIDDNAAATIAEFEAIRDTNTLVAFYPTGDTGKTSYNVKLTQMPLKFYVENRGDKEGYIEISVEEIFNG